MIVEEEKGEGKMENTEKLLAFFRRISDNLYYKEMIDFDSINLMNIWDYYFDLPVMDKNRVFDNIHSYFSRDFYEDCKEVDLEAVFFDMEGLSKNHDKVINGNKNKWMVEFTTGTTGKPFPVVKASSTRMIESAYLLKQRKRRDSSVNLQNGFKFLHSWQPELNGIDVWKFNEEDIKCITDIWLQDKPKWMLATPLIYSKYAEYILNNGINVFEENDLSFLEYTSQYMQQEEQEKIKRVFQCPLVSSFGSRECWNMAYECSEGNLHVNNEYLLVDIVDENGKVIIDSEIEGNVIITHLANMHMPFIKYIFDDRAKKKRVKCKCGNESEIICFCQGRESSKLVNTPYYGTNIFRRVMRGIYFHDNISDIKNICIIQDEDYHISVFVEKGKLNDIFFEKRFVERTKSVVPEIDNFKISFIYGSYISNEVKNCKSEIFKNILQNKR